MKLETIRLQNFKTFKQVEMKDIPQFCVVVGANGAGKSTLFDVFHFLKDCLTYNVTKAIQNRGGFHELISRGADGENIIIEIQYRLMLTGKNRLVTYLLEIGTTGSKAYVAREVLRYKRGAYGSPFHFLDFRNGTGYAISNEEDFDKEDEELDKESQQIESSILAIKGLGQFQKFKAANALRQLI